MDGKVLLVPFKSRLASPKGVNSHSIIIIYLVAWEGTYSSPPNACGDVALFWIPHFETGYNCKENRAPFYNIYCDHDRRGAVFLPLAAARAAADRPGRSLGLFSSTVVGRGTRTILDLARTGLVVLSPATGWIGHRQQQQSSPATQQS